MKVKVGNVNYEIEMTTSLDRDMPRDTRGVILYEQLRILLDKELPDELIEQTLYHEISHAMCEQTSFNNMLMEKLGDNGYEIFIDSMGKILYNLIHNNDLRKLEKFVKETGDE